jgi:hypothetical protein
MTVSFEPLSAKQQLVRIALVFIPMVPMALIAAFWRNSLVAQHFGAVCDMSIIASASISVFSRVWVRKTLGKIDR